jgi:hypothetical protein
VRSLTFRRDVKRVDRGLLFRELLPQRPDLAGGLPGGKIEWGVLKFHRKAEADGISRLRRSVGLVANGSHLAVLPAQHGFAGKAPLVQRRQGLWGGWVGGWVSVN